MAGINKAIIVGNLGQDPEIRYFQDGSAMATFSVATSEQWTDKNTGERREKTEWHRIVAFRRLAEICAQYLHKGKQVYIEGKIQTREWEDRDGNKRWTTEIVANTMQMLGPKTDGPGGPGGGYGGPPQGGGGYGGPAQGGGGYGGPAQGGGGYGGPAQGGGGYGGPAQGGGYGGPAQGGGGYGSAPQDGYGGPAQGGGYGEGQSGYTPPASTPDAGSSGSAPAEPAAPAPAPAKDPAPPASPAEPAPDAPAEGPDDDDIPF